MASRCLLLRALVVLWCLDLPATAEPADPSESALAPRAEAAAARGALREAAALWREVAEANAQHPGPRFRALLRLGELERDLGHTRSALETLSEAVALAGEGLGAEREAAARLALASVLRERGDRVGAGRELDEADRLASMGASTALRGALENERGRLHDAAGEEAEARRAFARAATLAESAGDASLAFRARANALHLARDEPDPMLLEELARARAIGEALAADHHHAQSWLLLGRAGARLAARGGTAGPFVAGAESDLKRAWSMASDLADADAASWALGSLAELYAAGGREAEALPLVGEALRAARLARQPDAEIRWLALLASLERSRGDRAAALRHLELAAERVGQRRLARASLGPDVLAVASSASERAVYLDLVDLLLQRAREQGEIEARRRDLVAAQRTMERLKAAELRDYFRDDCVDAYREKLRDPASVAPDAAVIYPIVLPDRLEILVSSHDGIRQFTTPVAGDELDAEVERFRRLLRKVTTSEFRAPARRLHDLLVAPLLPHLQEIGVTTLVFVTGGSLRTVPMAALYDGERFLIERFTLAVTPGLELTDPGPVDAETASVVLGGLSESVQGFPALGYVPGELESARQMWGGRVLLDSAFTTHALTGALEHREWSVVHIATHGVIGAEPADSFLLTWDGRLSLDGLAEAVGAFRYRDTPLDLILLSACDTAAGDERAALGLAGIAVKAGARSAMGTLWTVNDEATAMLVESFYRRLREPGTSRAQALQGAQLELLAERRTRHPRYWSPFLLIGSWL